MYDKELEDFLNDEPVKKVEKKEIIIDNDFKKLLWDLTSDEYENLKQSLIKDGCRDALILWGNTLIDGHNRYEICKAYDIEFRTIEKHFNSRKDVLYWIDENQLSRRNLLDWQQSISRGRLSKKYKLPNDGSRGNQVGKSQNVTSQTSLAKELGVSKMTLNRDEKFVDAYDKIVNEVGKDKAVEIVAKTSKQDVLKIAQLDKDDKEKVIEKLNSRTKYKSGTSIVKEVNKEKHFEERKVERPLNIKIYNDDCRNILKDLPDNSIDCILTDPPYAIDFVSSWKAYNKEDFEDSKNEILPLLKDVCILLQQKCKKDAHLYFFSSWMSYSLFENIISEYFDISNVIIWEKNNTSLVDFDKRYGFSYEQIIFCKQKGNNERMLRNKSSRDVVHFDRIANPDHTCEKPVKLLEYFIDNSTVENELVVDCFAGTFNSMVAARNLKRSYIGIELKNEFYKKGEIK